MPENTRTSNYLQYLPAIYSEVPFLNSFLTAFEQVMNGWPEDASSGDGEERRKGLEEMIADIAYLFDPVFCREEFLDWLSGWVALSLRADWTIEQKRSFIADIVPLYRSRGTKASIIRLLRIYTIGEPSIDDGDFVSVRIGVNSRIGQMKIGEPPPYFFRVIVNLGKSNNERLRKRQTQIARALIDMQKPAHTNYELKIVSVSMKIGRRSTIGVDTLIGQMSMD